MFLNATLGPAHTEGNLNIFFWRFSSHGFNYQAVQVSLTFGQHLEITNITHKIEKGLNIL